MTMGRESSVVCSHSEYWTNKRERIARGPLVKQLGPLWCYIRVAVASCILIWCYMVQYTGCRAIMSTHMVLNGAIYGHFESSSALHGAIWCDKWSLSVILYSDMVRFDLIYATWVSSSAAQWCIMEPSFVIQREMKKLRWIKLSEIDATKRNLLFGERRLNLNRWQIRTRRKCVHFAF